MTLNGSGLDRSAGFVMGVTYRKLSGLLQSRLKEYDITPEQWSILYHIDQAEGLIQKELAERTFKDKPTTTRILDQLENKGLVYKKAGEKDRRSFLVYITEKGKSLMQVTTPIEGQVIDIIKECVSEEEYELLLQLLFRINQHVSERTDGE
ncbi:MarR family transcriptional regulator [Paenibacillus oenotherae]|uniref:MarR family transcriptional regulator n=2 Tax=Paenibacillus oenotherae TaxID=1435645 RepID=A0ABS7D984_9BACL|nr:MarR family transcriptional regulator [Paenibacillus oenotherae]MBW7476440.1 MarR family transcriptional regulator [Paenibacillus oenotherae]